jgi:hypothetical protein
VTKGAIFDEVIPFPFLPRYAHRYSALRLSYFLFSGKLDRDNAVDFVLWESRSVSRRFDAVEIGSVFLCMVRRSTPNSFADAREHGGRAMFPPQDPPGGIALLAKGQTRIERVPQTQFEEC